MRTSWEWNPIRKGMGVDDGVLLDHYRLRYSVGAIKRELDYLGFDDLNPDTDYFGIKTEQMVKAFQDAEGLPIDGKVGPLTANALWRTRIQAEQLKKGIKNNWLRAQINWESSDDPGAENTNSSGSRDRGLIQDNSDFGGQDDNAFDPAWSIPRLAGMQAENAATYEDCVVPKFKLAVAHHRFPVGARYWCENPDTPPERIDFTIPGPYTPEQYGKHVVFYVGNVHKFGRNGWWG